MTSRVKRSVRGRVNRLPPGTTNGHIDDHFSAGAAQHAKLRTRWPEAVDRVGRRVKRGSLTLYREHSFGQKLCHRGWFHRLNARDIRKDREPVTPRVAIELAHEDAGDRLIQPSTNNPFQHRAV